MLGRGDIPCDLLFIGEAPGVSEDALGQPFIGPAGKLLDQLIKSSVGDARVCTTCRRGNHFVGWFEDEGLWVTQALPSCGHAWEDGKPLKVAFTNVVGCIPWVKEEGAPAKAAEPDKDQAKACAGRLTEFLKIAKPKLVIRAGKFSEQWVQHDKKHAAVIPDNVVFADILHPAYILRSDVNKDAFIQRTVATIRDAVDNLFN